MGRNSGGVNNYAKAGTTGIAVNSNGRKLTPKQVAKMTATATGTSSMQHRDMEKQINRAISRYEAVMGVRERHVRIADISGAYGVTYIGPNGSQGIYLSRRHFDTSKRKFEAAYKASNYANGFKNVTNRAAQHTVTHELAHATWTSSYTSPKHKAAAKRYNTYIANGARTNARKATAPMAKQVWMSSGPRLSPKAYMENPTNILAGQFR